MTFDLKPDELELIEGWYNASAGESAHNPDAALFALLDKFGFEAHGGDLSLPDPKHYTEEYRPVIESHRQAILDYRKRHKDLECVKEAEKQEGRVMSRADEQEAE